jgi:hypothetical protein
MLQLVWCYEHCHKLDNADLRNQFSLMAQKCGAHLVRLKKASTFAEWASHPRPPFILIAEWREAKPLMRVLRNGAMPFITFVYSETPRSALRAHAWVSTLDANVGCVQVVNEIQDMEGMILSAVQGMHSKSIRQIDDQDTDRMTPVQEDAQKRFALQKKKRDGQKLYARTCKSIAAQGYDFRHDIQKRELCTPEDQANLEMDWSIFAPVIEPKVINYLLCECSNPNCWCLVEKLLVSAMPDHYID